MTHSEKFAIIGLYCFVVVLFLIAIQLSGNLNELRTLRALDERRIHRIERVLDGAIEQVNEQADDLAVLETATK